MCARPPHPNTYILSPALGMASGSTIQAKHIGKDILAGLRTIVGGELTEYSKMLEEVRGEGREKMNNFVQIFTIVLITYRMK